MGCTHNRGVCREVFVRKSLLAVPLSMSLLLPTFMQVSAQDKGLDEIAFTNGNAYVLAFWVAFEGETASSLFDMLMEPPP